MQILCVYICLRTYMHKSNRVNIKCNINYESTTISFRYQRGTIFKGHTKIKHHHVTNKLYQSPQLQGTDRNHSQVSLAAPNLMRVPWCRLLAGLEE